MSILYLGWLAGAVVAATCVFACEPVAREYELAPAPAQAVFPTAPAIQDTPQRRRMEMGGLGALPPRPPLCPTPGLYTCEDACPFAHADMCFDLANTCGVTCGKGASPPDWDVDDPCAWAGLRLVVTPLLTGPDCSRVNWIHDLCNEQFQAYCCTKDGSALPTSE